MLNPVVQSLSERSRARVPFTMPLEAIIFDTKLCETEQRDPENIWGGQRLRLANTDAFTEAFHHIMDRPAHYPNGVVLAIEDEASFHLANRLLSAAFEFDPDLGYSRGLAPNQPTEA